MAVQYWPVNHAPSIDCSWCWMLLVVWFVRQGNLTILSFCFVISTSCEYEVICILIDCAWLQTPKRHHPVLPVHRSAPCCNARVVSSSRNGNALLHDWQRWFRCYRLARSEHVTQSPALPKLGQWLNSSWGLLTCKHNDQRHQFLLKIEGTNAQWDPELSLL